jgi:hypothetical protein
LLSEKRPLQLSLQPKPGCIIEVLYSEGFLPWLMLIQSALEEMLPLSQWKLRLALISLNEILRMRLESGYICSFCFFFGNIISNAGIFFHFLKLNVSGFSSLLQFMKASSSCVPGVQHHCVATCRVNGR